MGMPVVTVAAGGLPVVDATAFGKGTPITEDANGRGLAVTKVALYGIPVCYETAIIPTTMSATDKSANIILSNGNLSVGTSTAADCAARSALSRGSSKKVYFEITWLTASFGADTSCGIATSTAPLGSIGVNGAGFLLYCSTASTIWFNNSSTGLTPGNVANGTVVCFAIDTVNSRGWIRLNGGNWNGNVANNPATNTGGVNIAALFPTNAAFVVVTMQQILNPAATINFGSTAFAQAIPSGFTAWDLA